MGIKSRDWCRDWRKEKQYKEDGTRRFKGWVGCQKDLKHRLFLDDGAPTAVQRARNETVEVPWALHLIQTTLTCLVIYGVTRFLPHLIRVYKGIG